MGIRSLGIKNRMTAVEVKELQMQNTMSFALTLLMGGFILSFSYLGIPAQGIWMFVFGAVGFGLSLLFNSLEKYTASKFVNVIAGHSLVVMLSLLFGEDAGFHYFLVASIGFPLLQYRTNPKYQKLLFAGSVIPIWILLQWYYKYHAAMISIDPELTVMLYQFNLVLMLVLMLFVIFTFAQESDAQVKQIEQQKDELKSAINDLEQFSYMASHDLKTPLIRIRSLARIVDQKYKTEANEELLEMVRKIETNAKDSQELIDDILEYSRAIPNLESSFALTDILEKLKAFEEDEAVELENFCDGQIILKGSLVQLFQVLSNLISNGKKYNESPLPKVSISFRPLGDYVEVCVEDNGIGIASTEQSKVFDPFYKGAFRTKESSTGLGLSIVKRLVDNNEGSVNLESDMGKGTTFNISWPIIS